MRALVLYYSDGDEMKSVAEAIGNGIRKDGNSVDIKRIAPEVNPSVTIPYQLVCVGAPVTIFWGGKFDSGVRDFLNKWSHLSGRKMAAFTVTKWFGKDKGLRNLMGLMEKQGAFVVDFVGFKGATRVDLKRAEAFGTRMGNIKV